MSTATNPRSLSPSKVFALGLIYILAVGVLNFALPNRVGCTLFYLLGSAFVGWGAGKRGAGILSLLSSLIIVAHDWGANHAATQGWIALWNMSTRVIVVAGAGWLTAEVSRLTRNLGRLVEERTSQWRAEAEEHKRTALRLAEALKQHEVAAEGLKQSQQQLADAMDLASLANWEYAVATGLYTFDDRFFRLYGSSGAQEHGKQMSPETYAREFLHPQDAPLVFKGIERALATTDPDYKFQVEHSIRRRDGQIRHVVVRVAIAKDAAGRTVKLRGVNQDITERKRLERQILEITDREQARIGQDIHDGLCQQLVTLAFDANALKAQLAKDKVAKAALAGRMADLLDEAITEARRLSRGLFPIRLQSDGLRSALEELAQTTSKRWHMECSFASNGSELLFDSSVATHLYRIAQEAVNNAIKHARPRRITIHLLAHGDTIELSVENDGNGMPPDGGKGGGMGLHIMEYRARSIGGTLEFGPGSCGGTIAKCRLPKAAIETAPFRQG